MASSVAWTSGGACSSEQKMDADLCMQARMFELAAPLRTTLANSCAPTHRFGNFLFVLQIWLGTLRHQNE